MSQEPFSTRNLFRAGSGLFAGLAGMVALELGFSRWTAWAVLGGLLVGALCALERPRGGTRTRPLRTFAAGAALGIGAGLLARLAGNSAGAALAEQSASLGTLGGEATAWAVLGLAAGALPGFFSFSGALSRDGALGAAIAAIATSAWSAMLPGTSLYAVGGLGIAVGYVLRRRSHAAARLVRLGPDGPLDRITLRQHWITLGSGPECDLQVDDSAIVDIKPLVLTFRDGAYWVSEPAGHSGGLKVNGKPSSGCALSNGDVIEMGKHRFVFESLPSGVRQKRRGT